MNKLHVIATSVALAAAVSTTTYAGARVDAVKAKGFVQCGVSTGLPGFSSADDKGNWTGIDVDACRAVAAAVFGDYGQDPALFFAVFPTIGIDIHDDDAVEQAHLVGG